MSLTSKHYLSPGEDVSCLQEIRNIFPISKKEFKNSELHRIWAFIFYYMERLTEHKVEVMKSNFFFFSGNIMNHNTKYMENRNNVTEFVLLGLMQNPKLQKVIFVVFLVIYIISVVGNMFIMVTIIVSPLWSSPMYFFWPISPLLILATPL